MGTKTSASWYSDRLGAEARLTRWGHYGQPVLVFPTAGGDAEEIERMGLVGAVGEMLGAGRVKLYSCDSIAGRALADRSGSVEDRWRLLKAYGDYVAQEVVPAIRTDCGDDGIEVISAGASIGAFNAVSVLCRYPEMFRAAIGMSGTYDLEALFRMGGTEDLYFASPLAFLPGLEGDALESLRRRFVLIAYGEGRWENPGDAWALSRVLGGKGIPNRVDVWGQEWDHDWHTWRNMLPVQLDELVD